MLPFLLIKSIAIIFAITLHEFVRALTSTLLGDSKPKNDGRLTLNPINHFEPVGFILCYYSGFGWGKPVITNGMFYKNRKRDSLLVAIMPTVANFIVASIFAVILKLFWNVNENLTTVLIFLIHYNVLIFVYNIIPISPMDGAKVMNLLLPAQKTFEYMSNEKTLQLIFMLLLFWGYTGIVINPIVNFIYSILGISLFM